MRARARSELSVYKELCTTSLLGTIKAHCWTSLFRRNALTNYFSDRELGPKARTNEEITPEVWAGIVALVKSLINSGAFGASYPEKCSDGQAICGCDEDSLGAAVRTRIPGLKWPLETTSTQGDGYFSEQAPYAPPALLTMDFIEFVRLSIGKPKSVFHHSYARHDHLTFDEAAGRTAYDIEINTIFARNGLAYELRPEGQIHRTMPLVVGDSLRRPTMPTGDPKLDLLLEEARAKFSDVNPVIRREALERLCDAFERLKTLAGTDKQQSITKILDQTASEQNFRQLLEEESKKLSAIANQYFLRHHELSQTPVSDVAHVDYLFHRFFAMIQLLVRKNAPGYRD